MHDFENDLHSFDYTSASFFTSFNKPNSLKITILYKNNYNIPFHFTRSTNIFQKSDLLISFPSPSLSFLPSHTITSEKKGENTMNK